MKIPKIFYALSKLDPYELNSFKKYVQSPYFNVNENITNYYNFIYNLLKKGKDLLEISNDEYWNVSFPSLPYQNQKYLKLNSDLLTLLEEYMAQREFDKSTSLKANMKLSGARKRNIDKLYPSMITDLERLYKMDNNQSSDYYYTKYKIENSILQLINDNEKKTSKIEIETSINVEKISENLDIFYITEKLRLYCTLLSWQKMYQLNLTLDHMDSVLETANQAKYDTIPAIQLYKNMQKTYTDQNNDQVYNDLRSIMDKHLHLFPKDELKEIFSTTRGYIISIINKGNSDFNLELLKIYKETLENDLFLGVDGYFDTTMFRNIVFSALRAGEVSWTENFIQEFSKYLDPKQKENSILFGMARLEFYRKNYGQALQYISKLSFDDVWYNLGAKALQISCYYELDEFDVLESFLEAFKMYLRREKTLAQNRKNEFLNLIKYTKELIKYNPKNKEGLAKLLIEINGTSGLASKPWLIEKVEEMIDGKKRR